MSEYLKDQENTYEYVEHYCQENDLEFVKAWFNDSCNNITKDQLNLLLFVCFFGDNYAFDVAKFLLEKGADINYIKNDNYSLLHEDVSCQVYANIEFRTNIEDKIIQLPIDENIKKHIIMGKIDGIKFLLENGADPNIKNLLGKTALDTLIRDYPEKYIFTEAIDLLRKYGAKTSEELDEKINI